jgi:hypothetical protein
MVEPTIRVLHPGDTSKADPFTICIIANPALEAPWKSGQFILDPIAADPMAFDSTVSYIESCLFGLLPAQMEAPLADPAIEPKVRVVTVFAPGLSAEDKNSLVANDSVSNQLIARRTAFSSFLARFGLHADIAYAVSASESHNRATAWFTSDDDARGGVSFILDGVNFVHRFFNLIPGTIAIHTTANSLTALHEFQHALSSYSNGSIVDLYVDSSPAVNCKRGRPIPPDFGDYDGTVFSTDPIRNGLGYEPGWTSYHCALIDPRLPAVMDNYFRGSTPESCQNDEITRRFIFDRLSAKLSR